MPAKILACVGHITLKIMACIGHNSSNITGLCQKKYWPASATSLTYVIKKIMACVSQNFSNITGLCWQKFWPALATTPAISLSCVMKNTGLCWPQLQQYHWPVSAKIVACIGHITLKIMACIGHNSRNITGLRRPQLTHITGLRLPQHLSASAISRADISHTTTPASIPRFPGSRVSDQLGTVCRFWEWKQSAHCSAYVSSY